MLCRVAQELHAHVRVVLEPDDAADHVAEPKAAYRTARRTQLHRVYDHGAQRILGADVPTTLRNFSVRISTARMRS